MFLEMAQDALTRREAATVANEAKEFHLLGDSRKAAICASVPGADPMLAGYLLGLETARALLVTNHKALLAGVSI